LPAASTIAHQRCAGPHRVAVTTWPAVLAGAGRRAGRGSRPVDAERRHPAQSPGTRRWWRH